MTNPPASPVCMWGDGGKTIPRCDQPRVGSGGFCSAHNAEVGVKDFRFIGSLLDLCGKVWSEPCAVPRGVHSTTGHAFVEPS